MYLLDTNVVSELRKAPTGRADTNVVTWATGVATASLFVSVITIHELEIGVLLAERRDYAQAAVLRRWLDQQVIPAFGDRVLPIDAAIARRSAMLHVPDPQPVRDAFIAATAMVYGLTVVTRNVSDFVSTGVELINPWQTTEELA